MKTKSSYTLRNKVIENHQNGTSHQPEDVLKRLKDRVKFRAQLEKNQSKILEIQFTI